MLYPGKIGAFELREEIGRGGMATVFRAYQATVQRDVAIKVIRLENSDVTALQRFQREALLIARLNHPHILPVYDFDATHQPPYIVMRYADGGTLRDLMVGGPLLTEQLLRILRQVASALDFAHSQGIIHRDIKPSNILLDKQGNALISDFGIARIIKQADDDAQTNTDLTQTGTIVGTPGYMAPEQGLGSKNVTAQADIYSLGVMFFEMLTGQMPYQAENSIALILKHINDPIPVPTSLKPDLSPIIDDIIMQAMAKEATDRFATVGEFFQAIDEALSRPSERRRRAAASGRRQTDSRSSPI